MRALIALIFAHDMQIQVAHALCKQGCRLISYTANIRLVTIAACYNCPRSPLQHVNYYVSGSPILVTFEGLPSTTFALNRPFKNFKTLILTVSVKSLAAAYHRHVSKHNDACLHRWIGSECCGTRRIWSNHPNTQMHRAKTSVKRADIIGTIMIHNYRQYTLPYKPSPMTAPILRA